MCCRSWLCRDASVCRLSGGRFHSCGIDVDKEKVRKVNSGVCYVEDKYSELFLPGFVKAGRIKATTRLQEGARDADAVIICVPTPLSKKGEPELSYVKSVARNLSLLLQKFKLVILESTSYPGTTQEVLRPLLEKGGQKAGRDFALVYSPERIDYGNPRYRVMDVAKVVVGGSTPPLLSSALLFAGRS